MTYNLTGLQNITSVVTIMDGVNVASNGLYGAIIFICIYLFIFLIVKEDYLPNIFLGISTAMSIIAWLLYGLGIIPWWSLGINIVILISTIFYKIWGAET